MLSTIPFIELKNISKSYGHTHALKNVNFKCYGGEIRAILGENGAGKSTLIKIISGVVSPSDGYIIVHQNTVTFRNPQDAMALGCVCVFQELSLAPDLSVRDNIIIGSAYNSMGFLSSAVLQKARITLDAIGGENISLKARVNNLSLSQMQQVEITKALCKNPRLLILDESTSALNASVVEKIFKFITLEKQRGVSVLFISHRFHEIEQLADTISVFRDGQHIESFDNNTYSYSEIINKMTGEKLGKLFPPKNNKKADKQEVVVSIENFSWQKTLKNISFEVKKGHVIGLGGLERQGQTQLMHGLFGILKSVKGKVCIKGQNALFQSPREAKLSYGKRLVLVPEDRKDEALISDLSVMDNLELALLGIKELRKLAHKSHYEKFINDLSLVYQSLEQPLRDLSGGNQQKVALIKWLVVSPTILLLAEPTRGIDVKTKTHIYQLIRSLADDGMSVILLSTDYEELIHLCNEVHIFYGGSIKKTLVDQEITAKNIIVNSLQ